MMNNAAAIDEFFRATDAFDNAMMPTVTYVSWAPNGAPFVVKARLRLVPQGVDFAPRRFNWNGLVAESFRLADQFRDQMSRPWG